MYLGFQFFQHELDEKSKREHDKTLFVMSWIKHIQDIGALIFLDFHVHDRVDHYRK